VAVAAAGDPDALVARARAGDRAALARLLSLVERGGAEARAVGRVALPQAGATAGTVGVTGAPGAGKSTLTSALVRVVRAGGDAVAVLAVDPSSPFTGGAILGDRVRMGEHALDDGVFIRSMATRGHLGGLASAAPGAVRLLEVAGFPWVLVETVGVGQVEVEVAGAADTTVVVLNPGWGDEVQAAKAGLLEVADVFVVNKADRPGAADVCRDLAGILELSPPDGWRPPIVRTVATSGDGVAELWQAVVDHQGWLADSGELARRRQRRATDELHGLIAARLLERARSLGSGPAFDQASAAVAEGRLDPWTAAEELLADA
jgi:LAO/AO transport system kinase